LKSESNMVILVGEIVRWTRNSGEKAFKILSTRVARVYE